MLQITFLFLRNVLEWLYTTPTCMGVYQKCVCKIKEYGFIAEASVWGLIRTSH